MQKDKNFYIVDKSVLPEIFLRVMDVKNLLESGKEKTVQDAVQKVGISRSAFYKYRDAIFPLFENTRGKTVTVALNLDNTSGLLSMVLNSIANAGANILTINQNIPVNGTALVSISCQVDHLKGSMDDLLLHLKQVDGVQRIEHITGE